MKVYVPRMFSLLPIGELTLDDTGTASVEFPSDLPGDKEGNMTIIAKFEENPDFWECRKTVKRLNGVYLQIIRYQQLTGLSGQKQHPRWMIYTFQFSDRCLGPLSVCDDQPYQDKERCNKAG